MNIVKLVIVSASVMSAASSCLAAQGTIPGGALFDRLAQAAKSVGTNALPSLYDGSSSQGSAPTMPIAVPQTMLYRPRLDAQRVTRVNHLYKPGEYGGVPAGHPRGKNSLERGYAWTMHPAAEMLDSDNVGLKVAGFVLGVVLFIPALVLAGLNYIASNSRLTQGTSWHRHD